MQPETFSNNTRIYSDMTSYALFAADCDIYYYDEANPDLFCTACGSFTGKERYYPSQLKISKLKGDICYSYDGQLLLSKKAKEFLEKASTSDISFQLVNTSPEVFVLSVESAVTFDVEKRKTRFEGMCESCGNYETIVGSTPPFLKVGEIVNPTEIYITDIQFGSGKEKSPLYIVGSELAKKLKKEFKEVDLEEVRV